jgi:Ser/Thr protein kinase RdoA (MazF antagonist)
MDTRAIADTISVLSAGALCDWLDEHHDLPQPLACRLVSLSLNDVYRVDAGRRRCYLRVYRHDWRTRAEIESELQLVLDLHAAGVPVALPGKRRDGSYVTSLQTAEGGRFGVLWEEAAGASVRDITVEHARHYGRLAASLHAAADRQDRRYARFDLDPHHLIDEPLGHIRAVFGECAAELAELERVAERVRARIAALPRSAPDFGICHGDLHPGNARFDASGTPTLFDFDCCGYGWRAHDLAVFHWNIDLERRPKRWRETRWRAFLRGYREVRPLPEQFAERFPLFLVARMLWLQGLDCSGQSGYPPQWVTPEALRTTIGCIRAWEREFPVLRAEG